MRIACEERTRRLRSSERGSALLIVFLFAAVVAIMLYMEMPVAVFEAQRQKEQLLIDRGSEYAHAVKLYYRKLGGYPPSIDALENTNRMRFLRHRFKDPFTGKDDWRLLHAGPGGMLIDSKVKPIAGAGPNGTTNSSSNSTATGATNTGSNSSFGSSLASSTPPDVIVPPVPQRPPAVPANGSGEVAATSDPSQNPMTPLLQPAPVQTDAGAQDGTNANPQAVNPNAPAVPPAGQNAMPGQTAAPNGAGLPGGAQSPVSMAVQAGTGQTIATSTDATGAVQNLLANPNPLAGQGTVQTNGAPGVSTAGAPITGATGRTGITNSGGIAGVASKAGGHSIKMINDQDDYSLWEFYYDPSKDNARQLAAAQAGLQRNQNQAQGQNQTSGFGTSGFGTSSFGTSGFGQTTTAPPNQPSPTQGSPGSTMTTASGPP